jgi:hypothetical protein
VLVPPDVGRLLGTAVALPFAPDAGEEERLAISSRNERSTTGLLVLRSGSAKAVAGTMQSCALLAIEGDQLLICEVFSAKRLLKNEAVPPFGVAPSGSVP